MLALLVGFSLGFAGAIPVAGPTSAMVLDRALTGRERCAIALAFGAAVSEAAWGYLAFLGVPEIVARLSWLAALVPAASVLFPAAIAIAILWRASVPSTTRERPSRLSKRETAWHASAVAGFLVAGLNPMLFVGWSAVAAWFHGSQLLPAHAGTPVWVSLGIFLGITSWFAIAVRLATRLRIGGMHRLRRHAPHVLAFVLLAASGWSLVSLLRG